MQRDSAGTLTVMPPHCAPVHDAGQHFSVALHLSLQLLEPPVSAVTLVSGSASEAPASVTVGAFVSALQATRRGTSVTRKRVIRGVTRESVQGFNAALGDSRLSFPC